MEIPDCQTLMLTVLGRAQRRFSHTRFLGYPQAVTTGDFQPDHWLREYKEELLNVVNVLTRLVTKESDEAACLTKSAPVR